MAENEKLSFENLRNMCQELIQRKANLEGNKSTIASHDPILTGHNLLVLRNGDRAMDIVTEIDKLGKEDPTVALSNLSEIVVSGKYVNNSRRSDLWNKLDRIVSKTELISQHTVDLIQSYDATINDDIKISEDRLRRISELEQLIEGKNLEFDSKVIDIQNKIDALQKNISGFVIETYENEKFSKNEGVREVLFELASITHITLEKPSESCSQLSQGGDTQTQLPKTETTTKREDPPNDPKKFREFIIQKTDASIEKQAKKGKITVGYIGKLFAAHRCHYGISVEKRAILTELCSIYKKHILEHQQEEKKGISV